MPLSGLPAGRYLLRTTVIVEWRNAALHSKYNSHPIIPILETLEANQEQLLAAKTNTVRDVIAPNLRILFCGIIRSLSAAVGHHFARPGNRFWPALYAAGLRRGSSPPLTNGLFEERLWRKKCRYACISRRRRVVA